MVKRFNWLWNKAQLKKTCRTQTDSKQDRSQRNDPGNNTLRVSSPHLQRTERAPWPIQGRVTLSPLLEDAITNFACNYFPRARSPVRSDEPTNFRENHGCSVVVWRVETAVSEFVCHARSCWKWKFPEAIIFNFSNASMVRCSWGQRPLPEKYSAYLSQCPLILWEPDIYICADVYTEFLLPVV